MSFRLGLMAAAGAMLAAASPASAAFNVDFSGEVGAKTSFAVKSGDNKLTFSSPAGPGVFTVAPVGSLGLFTGFAYGLGDFGSFSGDTLDISFAHAITGLALSFGIEDLFGLSGSDVLTIKTNKQQVFTLTASGLDPLGEPEGSGEFSASKAFTSISITSANPFAIGNLESVPEPATLAVLGAGLLGLFGARRRG